MSILAAYCLPHPPVILPEIGQGREREIAATAAACREAMRQAAGLRPDTVVLTSPHAPMYADYFRIAPGGRGEGDFGRFGAPGVRVTCEYDREFADALCEACERAAVPAGGLGERSGGLDHGTMLPLYFLNEQYRSYRLVCVGLSGLDGETHRRFGRLIAECSEQLGRRTVFIASGDLSHRLRADGPYGFAPEGPRFDEAVMRALGAGRLDELFELPEELCRGAGECGLRSFWIMAGALDGHKYSAEQLSYEGPFGVGYGVVALTMTDGAARTSAIADESFAEPATDPFVRLARLGVENCVRTGHVADLPENLPAELTDRRAGVFVSLKKRGELRGCIGTISPVHESVALEIVHNAASACRNDPRFPAVTVDELPELTISVDVLGESEPITSIGQLDPARYGVIVQRGNRRGLLLPALEGIDDAAAQVAIARRKAGIAPDEEITLRRFEVVRHT